MKIFLTYDVLDIFGFYSTSFLVFSVILFHFCLHCHRQRYEGGSLE